MGLVSGSKGFVELICKGSSAASMLGVKLGDKIEFFQLNNFLFYSIIVYFFIRKNSNISNEFN